MYSDIILNMLFVLCTRFNTGRSVDGMLFTITVKIFIDMSLILYILSYLESNPYGICELDI